MDKYMQEGFKRYIEHVKNNDDAAESQDKYTDEAIREIVAQLKADPDFALVSDHWYEKYVEITGTWTSGPYQELQIGTIGVYYRVESVHAQ